MQEQALILNQVKTSTVIKASHWIHRSHQWNNTDGISKHRLSPYNAHCLNYNFSTHTEQHNSALNQWAKWKQFALSKDHLNANNDNADSHNVTNKRRYLHLHGTTDQEDR